MKIYFYPFLQSSSSTESESIPFANDNAGTIKQQKQGNRAVQGTTLDNIYGSTQGSTANPGKLTSRPSIIKYCITKRQCI